MQKEIKIHEYSSSFHLWWEPDMWRVCWAPVPLNALECSWSISHHSAWTWKAMCGSFLQELAVTQMHTRVCACVQWRPVHALYVFKPQLKNESQKIGRFLHIFQSRFQNVIFSGEPSSLHQWGWVPSSSPCPTYIPDTAPGPNTKQCKWREDKAGANSFWKPCTVQTYNRCSIIIFYGNKLSRVWNSCPYNRDISSPGLCLTPPRLSMWPWGNYLTTLSLSSWTTPALQGRCENFTS